MNKRLGYDVTNISDILDAIYKKSYSLEHPETLATRRLLYCSQYGLVDGTHWGKSSRS
jgi:hypothetical protein